MAEFVEPEEYPENLPNNPAVIESSKNLRTSESNLEEVEQTDDKKEISDREATVKADGEDLIRKMAPFQNIAPEMVIETIDDLQTMNLALDDASLIKNEAQYAAQKPGPYKALAQWMSNAAATTRSLYRRLTSNTQVAALMDASDVKAKIYAQATRDFAAGRVGIDVVNTAKNESDVVQTMLGEALENDTVLKEKVKGTPSNTTSSIWEKLTALAKVGAYIFAGYLIFKFLQGIADALSGCYMYTSPNGSIETMKLDCPTGDATNREHCNCTSQHPLCIKDNVNACCAGEPEVSFPFCCDAVARGKFCNPNHPGAPDFINYVFKLYTPWDLIALLAQAAVDLGKDVGSALSGISKYIWYILGAIGIILILVFVVPWIINLLKK